MAVDLCTAAEGSGCPVSGAAPGGGADSGAPSSGRRLAGGAVEGALPGAGAGVDAGAGPGGCVGAALGHRARRSRPASLVRSAVRRRTGAGGPEAGPGARVDRVRRWAAPGAGPTGVGGRGVGLATGAAGSGRTAGGRVGRRSVSVEAAGPDPPGRPDLCGRHSGGVPRRRGRGRGAGAGRGRPGGGAPLDRRGERCRARCRGSGGCGRAADGLAEPGRAARAGDGTVRNGVRAHGSRARRGSLPARGLPRGRYGVGPGPGWRAVSGRATRNRRNPESGRRARRPCRGRPSVAGQGAVAAGVGPSWPYRRNRRQGRSGRSECRGQGPAAGLGAVAAGVGPAGEPSPAASCRRAVGPSGMPPARGASPVRGVTLPDVPVPVALR